MKTASLIRTLLLTSTVALSTITAQADENTDAAVAAAEEWLSLIEAEEYVQSFQEAAPVFQEGMTAKKWKARMSSVRRAFGKTASRELIKARFTTSLPDAPDGEYVVIQFNTSFSRKSESVETITPMKVDGTWRVSGYYIK